MKTWAWRHIGEPVWDGLVHRTCAWAPPLLIGLGRPHCAHRRCHWIYAISEAWIRVTGWLSGA